MIFTPSRIYTPNPGNDVYIAPVSERWYMIPHSWACEVITDCGRIRAEVGAGFLFDGRSGGLAVDILVPNLGTQAETKRWLAHDLWGHGIALSFEETNDDLRMGLRDDCGYSRKLAGAIHAAVSASESWFGEPAFDDRSYPNLALIHVRHYPK